MIRCVRLLIPALAGVLLSTVTTVAAANPCLQSIDRAERQFGIPHGLLRAVGTVESGRPDASGQLAPWPWTLNVAGDGRWYETAAAAQADLTAVLAAGVRSVDVGCLQINLAAHPQAFSTPATGLEPDINATYAAQFLAQLKRETGTWDQAVAYYHSRTPHLAAAYRARVSRAHWGGGAAALDDDGGPMPLRALGADYRPSPITVGRGFDAADVLAQLRESRRIAQVVRRATDR